MSAPGTAGLHRRTPIIVASTATPITTDHGLASPRFESVSP